MSAPCRAWTRLMSGTSSFVDVWGHQSFALSEWQSTPGDPVARAWPPSPPPRAPRSEWSPTRGIPPIRRLGSSVVCMDRRPCLRSPVHGGLPGPGFLDCLVVQSASGVTALPVRRSLTWIDGTPAHRAYSPVLCVQSGRVHPVRKSFLWVDLPSGICFVVNP